MAVELLVIFISISFTTLLNSEKCAKNNTSTNAGINNILVFSLGIPCLNSTYTEYKKHGTNDAKNKYL